MSLVTLVNTERGGKCGGSRWYFVDSAVSSELSSTSGLSVRHVESIADKKMPDTPSFCLCPVLSNEPLCAKKFHAVPEIVGSPKGPPCSD